MTAVSKVLVATDFGAESEAALGVAAMLARSLGASIHVLHVVKDPAVAIATPELFGFDSSGLREHLLADAARRLKAFSAPIDDVPVTTECTIGYPAETIAERAAGTGANLIVMGTHGRGGVQHLFLGSVAERVIRQAPCPVVTVRGSGAVKVRSGPRAVAAQEYAGAVA